MSDNIQTQALAIILIFPILSTLALTLRCISRSLSRQFGLDDTLIVLAWLLAIGQAITVWICYHSWDIPKQSTKQQIQAQKVNLANQLLYNPILAIVKASVIVFLFRLEDRRPVIHWNLHVLFWVNLLLMVAIFLADLFQCTPLHYVYDYPAMDLAAQRAAGADETGMSNGKVIKGGKCIGQIEFFLSSAALTVLTDIWLLCIPTMVVWRLQMNRRKKIAIIAVLSMGAIVTIIGIARLVIYAHRFRPNNNDPTYNIGHTISSVEVNVAIITASATALSTLINRFAPRIWSSRDHYNTSGPQRRVLTPMSRSGTGRGRERSSSVMMRNLKGKHRAGASQEHIMGPDTESSPRSAPQEQ
ncbi:uncharacterized protein BDV17DRAFT_288396 [Aspergillus undulatus]|uniref:uncharacterized protein n=1 Tax=Aspergillus undulatus TaxID=1810928 RepID=UPI003CCD49ED